jgi:hypothetical protein
MKLTARWVILPLFAAAGIAMLAGANRVCAQTATPNVAQVFRPEGLSGNDTGKGLEPEDPTYITGAPAGASSLPDEDNSQQSSADPNSLSATPLPQLSLNETYVPITGGQRLYWLFTETLGPWHLVGGIIPTALGTALDDPHEDGPHWGGFGERYGIRLTGIATSNVMEAGLSALWGKDPRYFRKPGTGFRARMKNVVMQTFETRDRDGKFSPAYPRYMAITGSNFLSNAWRPDSEADTPHALLRTAEGFGGQIVSNAWEEFWPDVRARFHHGQ